MNDIKMVKTNRGYAIQFFGKSLFGYSVYTDFSFFEMKKRYGIDEDYIKWLYKKYGKYICSSKLLWFKYEFAAEEFMEEIIAPLEMMRKLTNG